MYINLKVTYIQPDTLVLYSFYSWSDIRDLCMFLFFHSWYNIHDLCIILFLSPWSLISDLCELCIILFLHPWSDIHKHYIILFLHPWTNVHNDTHILHPWGLIFITYLNFDCCTTIYFPQTGRWHWKKHFMLLICCWLNKSRNIFTGFPAFKTNR